jgi:hypothetical protein
MIEFEIGGHTYKADKMSAMQQLHVSRRLAPVVPKILPAMAALAAATEQGETEMDLASMAVALQPAADALAAMSDDDSEYVYSACLSVVSRKESGAWASVWSSQRKALMFEDLDLGVMTQLVFKVVGDSLAPFIRGFLSKAQSSALPTA